MNLFKSLSSQVTRYYRSLGRIRFAAIRFSHFENQNEILTNRNAALTDARYNKGLAFTMKERQLLSLHGLMPCSVRTMEDQVSVAKLNFETRADALGQFTYLMSLRSQHERVFFRFISENLEMALPVVYTPTVGSAVNLFSTFYRSNMGMYVTIFDRGHIVDVLRNWQVPNVRAVCVTDGGRILGLGDMGANGMGIVLGKLFLYTALGRVPPQMLLPITLDVGTDNETLLKDPLYIGARVKRVKGKEYDDLVEEFMHAIVERFGSDTLIHFEDFSTPNAYKFLSKYQHNYNCFNDDIQGTGAMGLAGILSAERLLKWQLEDQVILFIGAGSAAMGIADLLISELQSRGLTKSTSAEKIYLFDLNGLVTKDSKHLNENSCLFAKDRPKIKDLLTVVNTLKPSIIIAATGTRGILTEQVLSCLAKHVERPVIFALSNPTSNAECTAEQAFTHTEGRCVFSSGSPFPPVLIDGKRYISGQANNCLVFPGIALAAICMRAHRVPQEVFLKAAHTLAQYTSEESLQMGNLYPSVNEVNDLSFAVAMNVAQYLIDNDLSNVYPVPKDLCAFLKTFLYRLDYGPSLPETWKYPKFTTRVK